MKPSNSKSREPEWICGCLGLEEGVGYNYKWVSFGGDGNSLW